MSVAKLARDIRPGDHVMVNLKWRYVTSVHDRGDVAWCGGTRGPCTEIRIRGIEPRRHQLASDSSIDTKGAQQ